MIPFDRNFAWGIASTSSRELERSWQGLSQGAMSLLTNSIIVMSSTWSNYSTPKVHMLLCHMLHTFLKEAGIHKIDMTAKAKNYSADTAYEYDMANATNLIISESPRADTNNKLVSFIYLSRRYTTLRDHLMQYATEHPNALTCCENLEALYNSSVFIFKDRYDNYSFITNDTGNVDIEKTIGLLPTLYPALRDALNNSTSENSLHLQLALNAFYNGDAEGLIPIYQHLLQQAEALAAERIYEDFKTHLLAVNQKGTTALEAKAMDINRRIEEMLTGIASYQNELKEIKTTLLGYALGTATVDLSIVDALKRMSNVKLVHVDSTKYTLRITTPILYYNVRDVQMYYKHADRTNVVTQQPWMAQLIKDTFINQKYKLITTTDVTCPWTSNSSNFSSAEINEAIPNPHLAWYQCYNQARQQYQRAVLDNNWQTAINSMIAACASITFTDSTVVSRLIGNLTNDRLAYKDIKCFQNMETGEMFSAGEYKDKYEAEIQTTTLTTTTGTNATFTTTGTTTTTTTTTTGTNAEREAF